MKELNHAENAQGVDHPPRLRDSIVGDESEIPIRAGDHVFVPKIGA